MITLNNIGGATLSAALVADKALAPVKSSEHEHSTNTDLSSSLAAYLSLPGFNASSPLQADTSNATNTGDSADQAHALVKAVSEDETLKTALQQFDEGLKKLTERPETQIFQARFSNEGGASVETPAQSLLSPEPLPGVGEDGVLGVPPPETKLGADTNHDGKISEDERIRYEAPLTYRNLTHSEVVAADAQTNGPNAFSLTEVNRAYGSVATPEPA